MTTLSGPQVAAYAQAAGFTGDALVTIVAIGRRESGWDDAAQGDIAIQDQAWGPSVGVWQIRTLKNQTGTGGDRDIQALIPGALTGVPGSGNGDPARQAGAAFAISGGGSDFQPWSTANGLSSADLEAAQAAVGGAGSVDLTRSSSGISGLAGVANPLSGITSGLTSALADAMDQALGRFLGLGDGGVSGWVTEHAIRTVETIGGAVIFATALLMFVDVIGTRPDATQGLIGKAARHGRELAEKAVIAAAAA